MYLADAKCSNRWATGNFGTENLENWWFETDHEKPSRELKSCVKISLYSLYRHISYIIHFSHFALHSLTFQVFRSICKAYVYKCCFIFLDLQKPLVKCHKNAYTMLLYMTRRKERERGCQEFDLVLCVQTWIQIHISSVAETCREEVLVNEIYFCILQYF